MGGCRVVHSAGPPSRSHVTTPVGRGRDELSGGVQEAAAGGNGCSLRSGPFGSNGATDWRGRRDRGLSAVEHRGRH